MREMNKKIKSNMAVVPVELIEKKIYSIRGHKVKLDSDLAELYGVSVKVLNQDIKRNISRFPEDFMFQLSKEEFNNLRFHFGTSSQWGGRRYPPYAFTEQGVAMLFSVLRSERAKQVNIAIMRTFVELRQILSMHKELAYKLTALERKVERHNEEIKAIFDAIRQLMRPPEKPQRRIGFVQKGKEK